MLELDAPAEAVDQRPVAEPDVAVEVVHADDDVVVVDKPAGLVVHPGAGHRHGTLVGGLLARFPEIASVGEPERPGIVHRLDRGTSGLLAVARSAGGLREPGRPAVGPHGRPRVPRPGPRTPRPCGRRRRRADRPVATGSPPA